MTDNGKPRLNALRDCRHGSCGRLGSGDYSKGNLVRFDVCDNYFGTKLTDADNKHKC